MPLGGRAYLELIAVVDPAEAAGSARARGVESALAAGRVFSTWAVRCEGLEAARARLGSAAEARDGARVRPDGVRLAWRSLELAEPEAGGGVPFLIEWVTETHPGEEPVQHPSGVSGVRRIVLEDAPGGPLRAFLQRVTVEDVEVVVREGEAPRLASLELAVPGGTLAIP